MFIYCKEFSLLACPTGRYGPSCEKICDCGNGAGCDPETGACICLPGWIGKDCKTRRFIFCFY